MKNLSTCYFNYVIIGLFLHLVSFSANAQAVPVPINLSSFNADLVAEGTGNNPVAVTSRPIGLNYVLYDASFNTANPEITDGGLPATGTIVNGSDTWQLYPYSGNNALFFPPQVFVSTQSLNVTVPAQYSGIGLVVTAVNNSADPVSLSVTVHFTDNSSTTFEELLVENWTSGTPFLIRGFGAIDRGPIAPQFGTPDEPRLYILPLPPFSGADQLKSLDRIDITFDDVSNSATLAIFAVSGIPVVSLPITYSSLSAQYQASEKKVLLNWEAQTSLNSSGFEVERSSDGSAFASIARVNSNKIMGTSKYSYVDNNLQNRQAWFYRIKETLPAGTINYSKILNVKISSAASIKIIQSAGNIRLASTLPDKSFTYKIIDLQGRPLRSGTAISANQFSIDIRNLPSGSYILNVFNQTETTSLRFVK